MVWEQGSVVIVHLTRLTENGVAMCHRYWPEEGSDLYHIYEVQYLDTNTAGTVLILFLVMGMRDYNQGSTHLIDPSLTKLC